MSSHYKREFDDSSNGSREERRKKRKSRWGGGEQEKVVIPGLPTTVPKLTKEQERMYLLQVNIETISHKLRTGDLGIPDDIEARSPSPEPIYNTDGKRLNTREFRVRKKLEDERHQSITEMITLNPNYKAPIDYKPPQTKLSDKVLIPQEEYPDINFVGLLIGPRGNTLKSMEKDTGAKIIIRGKGSIKEGKIGRKDGQPLPGEDEPLHAFLTAPTEEGIAAATRQINKIIKQAIELPENQNNLRRTQLRELALLNGTLRENDVLSKRFCSNCGSVEHRNWQCPEKTNMVNQMHCSKCNGKGHLEKDCKFVPGENDGEKQVSQANFDEEYYSFMAELGGVSPPPRPNNNSTSNSVSNNISSTTAADGNILALPYHEDKTTNSETSNNTDSNDTASALLPTPDTASSDKPKLVTWVQQQGVWKQVVQDAPEATSTSESTNGQSATADTTTATSTIDSTNGTSATDYATSYYNYYLQQALLSGQDMETASQTALANYTAWAQYYNNMAAGTTVATDNLTAAVTDQTANQANYSAVPPPQNLGASNSVTSSNKPSSSYGYGGQ